jgi:transmembrane sensor
MNQGSNDSDEKAMRIAWLIAGYISQTLSPKERDELDRWVEESDDNMQLFVELTDEKNIETGIAEMQKADENLAYEKLRAKIDFKKQKRKKNL